MDKITPPSFIAGRWKFSEFVFVEYMQDIGFILEVGPFPELPDDGKTEQAFIHLKDSAFYFLTLTMDEWVLDVQKLVNHIPILNDLGLKGLLRHPPAFEFYDHTMPMRFFVRSELPTSIVFLRVDFRFPGKEDPADPFPPDWTYPPDVVS